MIHFYLGSLEADGAIRHLSFDPVQSLIEVREVAQAPKPGFLHLSDDFIFSAEADKKDGGSHGLVGAYSRSASNGGDLTLINRQSSGSGGSSHVSATQDGKLVFIANYSGGSISMFQAGDDGQLEPSAVLIQHKGGSVNEGRQEAPHPHCVRLSPDEKFLLVPDLGTDKVYVYALDRGAPALKLHSEWDCKPGGGPRHIAFHPNGKVAALARELDSYISLLAWDSSGHLTELGEYYTLPPEFQGDSYPSEIAFSPDGKHLYLANRGHNSIAIFAVEQDGRSLRSIGHESVAGDWPRHFAISPDGAYLIVANERSDSITIFKRDQNTGRLTKIHTEENLPKPSCIAFY